MQMTLFRQPKYPSPVAVCKLYYILIEILPVLVDLFKRKGMLVNTMKSKTGNLQVKNTCNYFFKFGVGWHCFTHITGTCVLIIIQWLAYNESLFDSLFLSSGLSTTFSLTHFLPRGWSTTAAYSSFFRFLSSVDGGLSDKLSNGIN